MMLTASRQRWAEENFGACDFGDQRLNKRMLQIAEAAARNSTASFPDMFKDWNNLKAAYRFFDHPQTSFEKVARAHWEAVRDVPAGTYLLISDSTELNFGRGREIEQVGPIGGHHSGRGFLLHSMLMADAEQGEFLGIAAQSLMTRTPAPQQETTTSRLQRPRESQKWSHLVEEVGSPPEGARFIHVMDSEADDFEVIYRIREARCDWLIRGCHQNRKILTPEGNEQALGEYLATLPVQGSYELKVRKRGRRQARTAKLDVHVGTFSMPAPRHQSAYVQPLDPEPITMNVVWVRETNPPNEKDAIEWVLLTSLEIDDFDETWKILEYYERRWIVEEWHKAIKTGCRLEERQLKDGSRLEVVAGLFSVVAARLMRLRSEARTRPHRRATELVPPLWLEALQTMRKDFRNAKDFTIREFIRAIAKVGGFLARKSDGEPGWITIWRGWRQFHTYLQGYQRAKSYG